MRRRRATRTLMRGAALAALLALAGCKTELYSHLGEHEAVAMVAILLENGIDADRTVAKDGASSIMVERAELARSVDLLRQHLYPRQTFATMGDVFAQQGLVASPTEERARFVYAISQELSRTISEIDGVLSVRVHVVLPHNDPLRQDSTPAAASVFIRHDVGNDVGKILPQIKMLVVNSIEGLSYEKVSVILIPVDQLRVPPAAEASAAFGLGAGSLAGLAAGAIALAAAIGGGGYLLWSRRRRAAAARPARPAPLRVAS